jgi:hypothetical protein
VYPLLDVVPKRIRDDPEGARDEATRSIVF